ncbi:MAG: MFS transporter [SAR324 cluster bacterium]|nr:MFS transporter [SAR324 cluster bacterium]
MLNPPRPLPPRSPLGRLPFYYGWVVVAVAFVTMGIGVNIRTAFSLLFPPILDEFGWTRSETAATFSIGFLASTLITPLLGGAMDRLGPRWVVPFGAAIVSVGLVLATFTTQPWHLFITLGLLVVGGTVIFSYIGHSMFLPLWFVRRRGLAVGIAFSGVGVGSILLFPWFQHIIDTAGWRQSCWVMAALMMLVVFPLNLLLQRHRPEDLGLRPDGDDPAGNPAEGDGGMGRASEKPSREVNWTLRQALGSPAFWWIAVGYFCGLVIWYMVQVHQTKYLLDLGIGTEVAAYALGLVGLTGSIGLIGLGYISDRLGRELAWTVASLGFAGCYAVLLVMGLYPSPWLMYLMVVLQGLLGYGLASAFAVIPSEIFQGRSVAKIFGVLSIAASLGAAFGPWLGGALRDQTGSYAPAFWIAIVLSQVSLACIWMAAPRKGPARGPFSER